MRTLERTTELLSATCLAGILLAGPGLSLAPSFDDDDDDGEEKTEEVEEETDEWLAIVGGDVYPGEGGVLRGATILSRNGKIEELGHDVELPEGAEVLDATGYRVYPGLIAVSSFGLFGGSSDLPNSVDPFSRNMTLALGGGITAAVQGGDVAKLKRGSIEDFVVKEDIFTSLTYSTRNPSGKVDLREKFEAAEAYLLEYRKWQEDVKRDKELKEPSSKGVDSKALSVLRGEVRALFSADEQTDLLEIARLAQRFGFRPVIQGCYEGWIVADELGRAGASAIVTPRTRRSKSENLVRPGGSSIENAAKLHAAGVSVAIVPQSRGIDLGGIVGRDIMHLPIEAGFAVRGGLSNQAALEAITIVPARLMGIEHRMGSIAVGKDCDVIITDGDILHYETFTQWAVVDGTVVYDKQKEMWFAHIRPRPESALAPETKVDAGEGEEEVIEVEEETEGDDETEGEGDEG